MLKIVALVPCRGGSKRVKNKNARGIGGRSLFQWSIDAALRLGLPCYVSTEVKDWGEEAEECGAKWIKRPVELAGDDIGDYEVVRHALGEMGEVDLLLYLRPTTPFRKPAVVREAIEIMENEPYTSLRSVELMGESAYKCFERSKLDKTLSPVMRPEDTLSDETDLPNQQVTSTYKANGYIDIIRPAVLKETQGLWGYRKYGFVTPRTVEIDTEEDLEYAQWCYGRKWTGW